MSDASIDPETLAALLDGTLTDEERTRVLSLLSHSPAAYEDFLEASGVLVELARDPEGQVVPPPAAPPDQRNAAEETPPSGSHFAASQDIEPKPAPRHWRRRALWSLVPLLAAAGITIIVVNVGGRPDGGVLSVVDALSIAGASQAGWSPAQWAPVRGSGDQLAARVRAFRMGALLADLEVVLRTVDTARIRAVASSITSLAADVETSGAVIARIEQIQRKGRAATTTELRQAATEVRSLGAATQWFDLGLLTESARFAAYTNQVDFLAPTGTAVKALSRVLAEIDRLPSEETSRASEGLDRIRRFVARPSSSPGHLAAVAAALDSTVAEVGR